MKIQVERDVLAEAVAWTARALPARPAVPVLAGIRLQAAGELTLSSFDYDVSAQATVPVSAEEDGDLLVSGRLLAEITRSLPARPVEISSDGARATLTCGSATFTLLTMPSEDYPSLPEMPPAAGSIGSDAFASAVSQSATAAGPGRHAARADRRADRDRGRDAHPGVHRPVPAGRPRAALDPGPAGPVGRGAGAGPGAGRDRAGAHRRRRGVHRAGPARRGRRRAAKG